MYQQDNAFIHMTRVTKERSSRHQVTVLDWPARSRDLNPVENAWSILVRRVYAGGRQLASVQELEAAVTAAWREIGTRTLQQLVNCMKDRLVAVVEQGGGWTGY